LQVLLSKEYLFCSDDETGTPNPLIAKNLQSQIPDSRFQIPDSRLQNPDCRIQIAESRLQIPAFISQKGYFDCQKTKGAGFKPRWEAARSFNSRRIFVEIWEREPAPAELMPDITATYERLLSESAAKIYDCWRAQTK
jgi:hypothetical protein